MIEIEEAIYSFVPLGTEKLPGNGTGFNS